MALSPELNFEEIAAEDLRPVLKTFRFDFEKNILTSEVIDGIEAAKQIIMFALRIPRYAYPILSSDFGNEIEDLLTDNEVTIEYKKMELPRLIEDALIYLDFVESVEEFEIEHKDDAFYVNFVVHTTEGPIEMEEVFGEGV
ncbi:DUF2634 domain-containing protein [Parageobacillus thermoglucosidasius]|uniref:DUF2634 domain-containing protein n=1 Tax=Anoxybacillaceae TaxID=3120669 RepID=UPI00025B7BA4|nr:DUF2634 domain-containing protein [Parageobacillus thermoglucosidasius]EID42850.1 phage-like element PBSX protein xkdS [Parageobacillus thermoglucosidasius TNO-09.020]KYD17848.1 hypothetical protein B4168_2409 [Anoxybacillus flavithermus]OAO85371.1 hypothetical protein GT23_3062 [Parageobacillus thermoglucosidasius]